MTYFTYKKKSFLFDMITIILLCISCIFLSLSYLYFIQVCHSINNVIPFNQSNINFWNLHYYLFSMTSKQTIENYLLENMFLLKETLSRRAIQDCFVKTENNYINILLQTIQTIYNTSNIGFCIIQSFSHTTNMEWQQKIYEFNLRFKDINHIFLYSYRSIQLGIPCIFYFAGRIGWITVNTWMIQTNEPKTLNL